MSFSHIHAFFSPFASQDGHSCAWSLHAIFPQVLHFWKLHFSHVTRPHTTHVFRHWVHNSFPQNAHRVVCSLHVQRFGSPASVHVAHSWAWSLQQVALHVLHPYIPQYEHVVLPHSLQVSLQSRQVTLPHKSHCFACALHVQRFSVPSALQQSHSTACVVHSNVAHSLHRRGLHALQMSALHVAQMPVQPVQEKWRLLHTCPWNIVFPQVQVGRMISLSKML
jgi:hypothetical protein